MKNLISNSFLFIFLLSALSCGKVPVRNSEIDPLLKIFIPNVLSFSFEEFNVFYPMSSKDNTWVDEMAIYDGWGNLAFLSQDFPANTPEYGWYGVIGEEEAMPGLYVYTLKMRDAEDPFILHGDLTVFD